MSAEDPSRPVVLRPATGAELLAVLPSLCPRYARAIAAYAGETDLSFHERMLAAALVDELAEGSFDLRPVFAAIDRLYPSTTSYDGRHFGPWVLMGSLLDGLIARGVDHESLATLLPTWLQSCWALALEDRFSPPHDGYW